MLKTWLLIAKTKNVPLYNIDQYPDKIIMMRVVQNWCKIECVSHIGILKNWAKDKNADEANYGNIND